MSTYWEIVVPAATTNLITNPSFETNTTGWVGVGTNTIAQSSTQAKWGAYSLEMTNGDAVNQLIASYPITLTAVAHTFSAWVYLNSDWDAGALSLVVRNLTSVVTDVATTTTTTTGAWVRLQISFTPDAGDLAGNIEVWCASPAGNSKLAYVDGAFCEALSYVTTFCDGDQPGCEWNGAEHASTSTRSAQSRAGGRVYNLDTDYGFNIETMTGVGAASQSLQHAEYEQLPGGKTSGMKVNSRAFSLGGIIYPTTDMTDLHAQRQALFSVLDPDAVPRTASGPQPVLLRYTNAAVTKEIAAHYEAGLEGNFSAPSGDEHEKFALRFLADDPFWYQIGESAAILDSNDTATLRYLAGRLRSTGQWDDTGLGANPTTNGTIYAVAVGPDGKTYIGGDFTGWGGVANRDYIARYDPVADAWETVGGAAAVGGVVRALAFAPDGTLYAGGAFVNVGDADGDRIASYDIGTDTWSSLAAAASNGTVLCIAIGLDGTVYFGGSFINWDGDGAQDYISSWTGAAYVALGSGTDDDVDSIAVNPVTGVIASAGNFANAGGAAADGIALWDGSAWSSPSSGLTGGAGFGNTVAYNRAGILYFGGSFTTVDGVSASYIAQYNGTAWTALGAGVGDQVLRLLVAPDGTVYAAGVFATAGGLAIADRIARWNLSSWSQLDVDLPGAPSVWGLAFGKRDPVISRNFDIWLGLSTTGAGYFGGSTTVTNSGTAPVYPKLVISRSGGTSATLNTLRNETTGYEMLFNAYALLDGETLTIDLGMGQKRITSDFFGRRPDAVLSGSDLGVWTLQPGANNVTCFVSTAGAPTVTAYLLWRDAYKALD